MTFYVIRHIPTQQLLPARVPASVWKFDDPLGLHEPRLFRTERAAKNCATCWAKGEYSQVVREERDGWDMPPISYLAEAMPTAVEGRRREDLEVVPVLLLLQPAGFDPHLWPAPSFFKKGKKAK